MSGATKPPDRVQAMRDLIRWANSPATARALEAMELLDMTDEELDRIFTRNGNVVKIPHFGRIS